MNGFICKNCGEKVDKSFEKNSTLGCLMWLFFIFISFGIGLIFFIIYKLNNRALNCCPKCKAENTLVPIDSIVGQKLLKEYSLTAKSTVTEEYGIKSAEIDEYYENLRKTTPPPSAATEFKVIGIIVGVIVLIVFVGLLIFH